MENEKMRGAEEEFIPPYRTFVFVWMALLSFTGLTIWVSQLDLGRWRQVAAISTGIAVLIASFKASLVLYFFMGLKYERPVFRWMFLVTAITLAIFILLTYADVLFR